MKQKSPKPVVDAIIQYKGGIVLIKRRYKPYGWALPGGFVDYGETLEHAAMRESKEETGLKVRLVRQLHTYSDPKRDPRQHTISTVFIAEGYGKLKAGDDAADAKVFKKSKIPKCAFDHGKILRDYVNKNFNKRC